MTNAIAKILAESNKAATADSDVELTALEESDKKLMAVIRKRYNLSLATARAMVGAVDEVFAEANLPVVLK